MKKFTAILSLVLSAALLFALCACGSTWGKVKSAYEKEGYSELKISEKLRAAIEEKTDEKLEDSDATLHFMTKAKINDDDSDAEANEGPHAELGFDGTALVLAVEGLAGAAERVDPLRIAGLKHHEHDGGERGNAHGHDERKAYGAVGIIHGVARDGSEQIGDLGENIHGIHPFSLQNTGNSIPYRQEKNNLFYGVFVKIS